MTLLAAALALALAAAPDSPDVVKLEFAWPEGFGAKVELKRTRERPGQAPAGFSLKGRLVTERRGEELLVRYRELTGPGKLDPLIEAGGKVTTVVNAAGEFVRVEDTEAALRAVEESLAKVKDAPKDGMERLRKMAPALFTKDASENWSVLVQLWNGQSLEVGEDYESESEVPVPALPGETVRIRMQLGVPRRLPCPTGGGRCVEARLRSEPNAEDVKRIATRLMKELGAPASAVDQALGEMSSVTEVSVVTEPGRLVPHRLEKTRITRVAPSASAPADVKGGDARDVSVWTYTYPAAR